MIPHLHPPCCTAGVHAGSAWTACCLSPRARPPHSAGTRQGDKTSIIQDQRNIWHQVKEPAGRHVNVQTRQHARGRTDFHKGSIASSIVRTPASSPYQSRGIGQQSMCTKSVCLRGVCSTPGSCRNLSRLDCCLLCLLQSGQGGVAVGEHVSTLAVDPLLWQVWQGRATATKPLPLPYQQTDAS